MHFPFPALVCDIGGTNVRLALKEAPDTPLEIVAHLKTADYPGLAEAILAGASGIASRPRSVIACGAGPVSDRRLKLTNAPWTIDGPAIAERLGLAQGLLLNDFEAQALSLPAITSQWVYTIGPDLAMDAGARVILGPGTGLGIGALIEVNKRHLAIASEASHLEFGPAAADEFAIWPYLERVHGRVTTESVMSGPGLVRLHKARMTAAGKRVTMSDGAVIVDRALADRDSDEAATVAMFLRFVARFAGDMAIAFIATGGVTLAGGILPRMAALIDPTVFRSQFEAKAPVDALAKRIATRLIIHSDTVLAGMAAIVARPDRYEIDYRTRAWR